jgi:hypothetical protein
VVSRLNWIIFYLTQFAQHQPLVLFAGCHQIRQALEETQTTSVPRKLHPNIPCVECATKKIRGRILDTIQLPEVKKAVTICLLSNGKLFQEESLEWQILILQVV